MVQLLYRANTAWQERNLWMGTHKKLRVLRVVCTLCTFLVVVFIFSNSLQNGDVSGGRSVAAMNVVNRFFEGLRIPLRLPEAFLRKTGHVLEYMLLGMVAMFTTRAYTHKKPARFCWALAVGLGTGILDECLQLFIPGRSGRVSDVFLDLAGAAVGALLAFAVFSPLFKRIKWLPGPEKEG